MTNQEIFDLYVLQSKNVRRLIKVKSNFLKDINNSIKNNDIELIKIKTKIFGILFCTFSEAQFIQIVHTPDGFEYSEIEEIKKIKDRNIIQAWKKMIDIALSKVQDWKKNADINNRRLELIKIIDNYIEPSRLLRNKLAHGQWVNALNSKNTKSNPDVTTAMRNLDLVEIVKWFEIQNHFGFIMRDLIQSPQKGFHNNYWVHVTKLKEYISKTKNWNFESKKALLMKKRFNQ